MPRGVGSVEPCRAWGGMQQLRGISKAGRRPDFRMLQPSAHVRSGLLCGRGPLRCGRSPRDLLPRFASYGRGAGGSRSVSAKQGCMSTGALGTLSCHSSCASGNKVIVKPAGSPFFWQPQPPTNTYKLVLHLQQPRIASCIQQQHLSPAAFATPWSG